MLDEQHRALKRWEKARQLSAVRSEPHLAAPLAQCRIRPEGADPEARTPVYIVAMFAKDLTCVKAFGDAAPEGLPGAYWLVRAGIRWEDYLPGIVRHYRVGLMVPGPFRPVRKIAPEIITQLESLPDRVLPEVFAKLRESGLLPTLPSMSRETCPQALPWENIRACFQDFQGGDNREPAGA